MHKSLQTVTLGILLVGAGLASCGQALQVEAPLAILSQTVQVTPIKKLQSLENPGTLAERSVYLQGRVGHEVPLLGGQAYQLQDQTGTIWVVTASTELSPGDEVLIEGIIQYESIPIAGQEWGEVYVREREQLERVASPATLSVPEI